MQRPIGSKSRALSCFLILGAGLLLVTAAGTAAYLTRAHWASYWSPLPSAETPTEETQGVDPEWDVAAPAEPDLVSVAKIVEPSVAKLTAALEHGDSEQMAKLTHPESRKEYETLLAGQPDRMQRLSTLLKTRKLVAAGGNLAEYEVTEDGRSYRVTFEKVGDGWLLHSF